MLFNLADIETAHVVYRIEAAASPLHGDRYLAWVGLVPLRGFSRLADIARHESIRELLKNEAFMNRYPTLTIMGIFPDYRTAWENRTTYCMIDPPALAWLTEDQTKPKPGRKTVRVMCNETQIGYESAQEACRELGISPGNMSNHLNGLVPRVKGLTFRYLGENE